MYVCMYVWVIDILMMLYSEPAPEILLVQWVAAAAVADNCLPVDALEVRGLRFFFDFFFAEVAPFGAEVFLWISSVLLGDERKNFVAREV